MFALWWREHGGDGLGQVIDLSIYEPLFSLLGPQALVYDQLGIVQMRSGNRAPFTAPRNAYQPAMAYGLDYLPAHNRSPNAL